MTLDEFRIGGSFYCGGSRFICTDIGSRVVVAIPASVVVSRSDGDQKHLSEEQTLSEGWLQGPPYAVAEIVFDEDDQQACSEDAHDQS